MLQDLRGIKEYKSGRQTVKRIRKCFIIFVRK
jgi:hypothetical protein